jgi:hypothetical protein
LKKFFILLSHPRLSPKNTCLPHPRPLGGEADFGKVRKAESLLVKAGGFPPEDFCKLFLCFSHPRPLGGEWNFGRDSGHKARKSLLVEAGGFPEGKFRRNGEKLYVFPIHGQLNSPDILFGKSVWLMPKVSW